ncbi:2-hydroxyacid dehydrogenase [Robiginitalea sp. IMCC43444]|uniref:2-hydroxyacid dehydrogenase n=1 Tax=Robiginitalea sp. IMCC43444 TaxID=3459121 RepID=UPI004043478A
MAILILRNDTKSQQWKNALSAVASDIRIYTLADAYPPEEIKMVAVWKHPKGSLNAFPELQAIHSLGAGVDFIFEDTGIPADIPIIRVVDPFLAADMAEFVLAQVMASLKRLLAYKTDQLHKHWKPQPYKRIREVRVGIMGLGTLGKETASLLKKSGFAVSGWTRSSHPEEEIPLFAGEAKLQPFLNQTDILVCLLPLTEQTRGILGKDCFDQLPSGAYLINVARGPLVRDEELIAALDKGHLSGASLDVFHQEPLPESHPFWHHSGIHITPHIASVSDPASVAPQIIENYRTILKGEVPVNQVSRKLGY